MAALLSFDGILADMIILSQVSHRELCDWVGTSHKDLAGCLSVDHCDSEGFYVT